MLDLRLTANARRILAVVALALASCKTPANVEPSSALRSAELEIDADNGVGKLPTLVEPAKYSAAVRTKLESMNIQANLIEPYTERFSHYLGFLGIKPTAAAVKKILDRIMESSTQYILCDSFEDWQCLEQTPWILPKKRFRQDVADDLGGPREIHEPLRVETYFTNQWDVEKSSADMSKMLALVLADKIKREAQDGMSLAIYGIDEKDGSMKPVYDAIVAKFKAGVEVRAVFDAEDIYKNAKTFPYVFSYVRPSSGNWAFDMADQKMSNIQFQYKNTVDLLNTLNQGISSDDQARARIEWPGKGAIMHNKFVVFKKGDRMSVWTGTANVADTCMGTERNSNVGVFIDNTEIAAAFQTEFEEMYDYIDKPAKGADKLVNGGGDSMLRVGAFHDDKTPNTPRYFRFSDVDVRLHFAPTDDGEHRVALPMLLSARRGDKIRISMFGAGGIEFVRAIQYAQAKGADVEIVFDRLTGSQSLGWLRDPSGNLLDTNPYDPNASAELVVRRSTWKKQNHHKSATLTRRHGSRMVPEIAIIGSQNWSKQGNDVNDENMLTFRTRSGDELKVAKDFNDHFDSHLWPAAAAGEMAQGKSYDQQASGAAAEAAGEEDEAEAEAQ